MAALNDLMARFYRTSMVNSSDGNDLDKPLINTNRPEDISGILTIHEIANPTLVVAPNTLPDLQIIEFNSPIKRVLLDYTSEGASTGVELYIVTGFIDKTDAVSKLLNPGVRKIRKIDMANPMIFPFEDGKGSLNIAISPKVTETNGRVYMEVLR